MSRARRGSRERGAVLAMTLILLLVLLGFAAFAVDLGAQYNLRRQGQSAADAAVLAGGWTLLETGDPQAVLDGVQDRVAEVMNRPIDASAWAACTDVANYGDDGGHTAASLGLTPSTECLSFSVDFERVRVRVPPQTLETHFAQVFGVDETSATAAAEASVVGEHPEYGGYALPFVALAGTTAGTQVCIRDSSASDPAPLMQGNGLNTPPGPSTSPDPCDSTAYPSASSTFGTYNPWEYGTCTQGPGNSSILRAMAHGIDHPTGVFGKKTPPPPVPPFPDVLDAGDSSGMESLRQSTHGDVRIQGADQCKKPLPNTLDLDTGLTAGGLRCGILSEKATDTCLGLTARLQRGSYVQNEHTFAGENMDNTPLWEFFDQDNIGSQPQKCQELAAATAGPGAADDSASWDFYDKFEWLIECITAWDSEDPTLLDISIGNSARFAFIPLVAEAELDGPDHVHINSYVPVFIDRLYEKRANQDACDDLDPRKLDYQTHQAGQQFSCGGPNSKLDRLSTVVFKCGMLPELLCRSIESGEGTPEDIGGTPFKVQLTE